MKLFGLSLVPFLVLNIASLFTDIGRLFQLGPIHFLPSLGSKCDNAAIRDVDAAVAAKVLN